MVISNSKLPPMHAGKYTDLSDAYLSVIKSLQHACMEARLKLVVGVL